MKLSIISPTLNSEATLERMIQSVLEQEFESTEHLIIDGGSSDGTLGLVSKFNHLKVISEPDEGIYDAMNKGISVATGEWIYFLGADDYLADDHVLRDFGPIFESELDVVYGDILDSSTGNLYDGPFDSIKIRQKNISHQAILFRREVFEQVGLFDKTYKSFADWDHNMRWMLNCDIRKKYVNRTIAVYSGDGFSFHNPDLIFQRDRLYRYLTYGKHELPAWIYWGGWGKELGLGIRHMDWARIKRAVSTAFEKNETSRIYST